MSSEVLPMFPLGTVLLPFAHLPLHIFEPRYRALVKDCLAGDGEFGVVLMVGGNLPGVTRTVSISIYDSVSAQLAVNTPDQAVEWFREASGPLMTCCPCCDSGGSPATTERRRSQWQGARGGLRARGANRRG